jgi:chromosome partitioning protein
MLSRADCILIPVAPSAIDIHATANFVRDLLLVGRIRTRNIQLAVVANRVRSSMPVYQPLERFLNSLGLPFLTRIRDSDVYVRAAESGIGIFEMAPSAAAAECAEFMPIVEWVGRQRDSAAAGDGKVIDLASRRWMERTPGLSSIGSRF